MYQSIGQDGYDIALRKDANESQKSLSVSDTLSIAAVIVFTRVDSLVKEGMKNMATEENDKKTEQEDPTPLTDEEFDELKKKEKRTGGIISTIIDFFTGFFQ